jgi:hypothetical protein
VPYDGNLDVLIRTGINDPVLIQLVQSLLDEAGIPFVTVEPRVIARPEGGNFFGWWAMCVPREREAETREILADAQSATPIEEPATEAFGAGNSQS